MDGPRTAVPEDPVKLEGFGPRDLYQRREKIFTRFVGGFFQRLRFFTGWPLLAGYFLLPWLSWDGRPLLLFDLPARQFHVFAVTYFPQDLWMLGWLLIIAAFGLFTVTTLVGRLWCGYTCPQTVWTAVFMWAEQIAEGPRHQRIRLDQAPWSFEKLRKRVLKHGMWLFWAVLTGVTFVGYFTSIGDLVSNLASAEAPGWAVFWVLFFTTATYVNAGWLREQVCIYLCPYARFQSAMIDRDTLVVSYDPGRGEPRGTREKTARTSELGDCIDCTLCVQVCPVGIDIRDGLQYQCIGCAHCIDACNQVMEKMDYAPGLIRYTTEHALMGGESHWWRTRSVAYATVLLAMTAALATAIVLRVPFQVDVVRERGDLFQTTTAGLVTNAYSLLILNKSQEPKELALEIEADLPLESTLTQTVLIQPGERLDLPLTLSTAREAVALPRTSVTVHICEVPDGSCVSKETSFLGPFR